MILCFRLYLHIGKLQKVALIKLQSTVLILIYFRMLLDLFNR